MEDEISHIVVQCMRPSCQFRYPANSAEISKICPKCGGPLKKIAYPRHRNPPNPFYDQNKEKIEILLDNIRSAYNVGSILRTADAAGVSHIHFAGTTPTPDHPKVIKTALGSEFYTPWTQHWNAKNLVEEYRETGYQIVSLEISISSESIFEIEPGSLDYPILFVLGNEVSGVDPEILKLSDKLIEIPMFGEKSSLNVSTAFGIAVFFVRHLTNVKDKSQ